LSGIQRLQFNNDLTTFGNGISFQLGAIAKLNKQVRVGLAYESPTWYEISDKLSQAISSVSANTLGELPTVRVNPMVINIYEPYQLRTPGKWTGSFAYIYKKSGLLSIDYSVKDFGNIEFSPNGDFRAVNSEIKNKLGVATELRIGGEYRIKGC
jgi:long-subunit fatty acid transport protein